jgi:predicted kinase
MSKTLVLLRGLPGSGKSTVSRLFPTIFCYEADMFFEDEDGNYNFEPSLLKHAHEWCRKRVELAMNAPNDFPANLIVVSNTFTQAWEMKPYFELAEKYGYRVHSIIVENRHGGKNIHGVPDDKLEQMKNRFQIKL